MPPNPLTHALIFTSRAKRDGVIQRVIQPITLDQYLMPRTDLVDLYWTAACRRFEFTPEAGSITWEVFDLDGKRIMRNGMVVEQPKLQSIPPAPPAPPIPSLAEVARQADMTPEKVQAIMDEQIPFPPSEYPKKKELDEWKPPWT